MSHATAHVDFEGLARAALSQAQDLLPRWFPDGKFMGREFLIGDLSGTPGESLSINTQTGRWADFATDDRGGDLVSLFAAMHRIGQGDAARQLGGILGKELPQARVTPLPIPESKEWNGIFPIPSDAPPPPAHHPKFGTPTHIAHYCDTAGNLLALTYRCEPEGDRKQVVPLTYCRRTDGRREWRWQSLPKPRSLYGAELLAKRPGARILLVEGEPKCDAGRLAIGETFIVMSWPGGAKAWKQVDWSILASRDVVIWPDADEPGIDAAKQIAIQLKHHKAAVYVAPPPNGAPQGWDIHDAIKEGWNPKRIIGHLVAPSNPLPLVFFDDIKPNFDTMDFVEDMLVTQSAIIIYGESNSGKTFFATDLALHVAAGRVWRDKDVLKGGVVYVALEGSAAFANRVEAWRRQFVTDQRIAFAAIPSTVNLLDPEADTSRLIDSVREAAAAFGLPVRLIVIDTLSRAMAGGNENAPDDMGAMVMNIDRIRAETGAAVLAIHHSGKDQAKGARGHSLLRAAVDTEIEISVDGAQRVARVTKQRELDCSGEYPFTLKVIELERNKRGKMVTSCVVEGSGAGHTASAVLAPMLRGHPRRALEVLGDLLSSDGKSGFSGMPTGALSVPDKWWRDRFYTSAMAGAEPEAKQKAFRRASDELVAKKVVGLAGGRVWIARPMDHKPSSSTSEHDPDTGEIL